MTDGTAHHTWRDHVRTDVIQNVEDRLQFYAALTPADQDKRRRELAADLVTAILVLNPRAVHGDDLEHALASALNRDSAENASNTPDWILAQFLLGCLAAWNQGVQQRETWYGRVTFECAYRPRPLASIDTPDTAGT